ncbi:uncharacterized protein LOC127708422 [Mytilus californianus]|uniref:uncharacterized protein LOC127708422 n=1 Tax=Mytilus californianus TaxID=6549 RepID=UPI0022481826|nr:uncharacterized protein LOC127708422 [Mytilus californianus]
MNIDINKKGTDVDTDNKVEAKLAPHDEAVKTTSEIDHGLEHDATDSTLTFKTENGEMEVLFEYPGGEVVVDKDASQHQVSAEKDSLLASNSTPIPEVTKCQLIQSVPKPMQTVASSGTKVKPVPSANFQNAFSKSSVNFNERAQETVLVPLVQNMNSRIECDPLTKPHSIKGNISHFPDYKKQISTPGFTMAPLSTKGTTLVPSTKSQNNVPIASKPTFIATTKLQMPATTKATNSTVSLTLGPSTTQQNAASGSQHLNLSTILQNFLSPSAASQNVNKKLVHSNITLNPSSKLVPFTGTLNSTNPTYILVLRSTPHSTTESSNVIKNQDTVCKLPLEPQSAGHVTDRQNRCLKESFVTLESSRKKDDHLTADEYVNVNKPIKIENVSETECGQFENIIASAKTSNKMKIENTSETEVCKHSSFCAGTVFTECQNTIKIEDSMDIESDQSNNKAMVESEVFLPVDKNENMFDTEKKVEHCLPLQNITMSSKKNTLPASITIQGQLSVQTQPQSQLSMQIRPEGQLSVQTQPQSHLSVQIQPEGELSVQTHLEGQPSVPTQPQGQLLVQKLPQPQVSVKTKIRAKLLEQPQLRAKLLRQKPPFQLLVQTKPQDHPFVLNKQQKSQAKIPKKKRKKKKWTKVIKTAKQECRTEEVGRFSSKAKSRDQMEVTLDRPWDLGTENIDLDQEDVADLSNSDTEMDTAQILHNPGEKKDKADSIKNEPKRLDKVNSEFSVSTRNREIYISLRKERETGVNQTIISTPVKKIAKKECRTEEVGRFSSEVNVSEHAYCTVGRGQMKATLDRPWDLGTENVDLDQENVADLSNSEMEMDTAQILHNPGDKKDLEIVDEKSIRKRKCLENVEKPQTEAESSSFIINKTEAININKSDIVKPGTNDKEDITAKPPDKKKKKRNIMTAGLFIFLCLICINKYVGYASVTLELGHFGLYEEVVGEKNYKGKLDDLDAKIRGNITLPSESNDIPSAPYPDLESFLMENGLVYVKSTDTCGIETQSNSGIETQSNSGIMTQSNSGIETQSNSGIETQSNSGIETQSNSGIETQSNSETEINNKVESVSNFVEAAAAHVNESGRVVDSVNQVTSSVMNNSLNVSIIDNVPTKIQSKVGVTVSQVIDVLRNLSENTKEGESVSQVNRVPVSVCSITSEPPIVTKEPKSASKIAIEKMDVVESVNRACNLAKDSNKDSYASDIQGYSNDITGIVEKFKEAFKLKFGQDINKMRCPKCLKEVYLDDFDEHSCENIQLKNQSTPKGH